MAESSTGEKTELPTPKKLRDAREKGQVKAGMDGTLSAPDAVSDGQSEGLYGRFAFHPDQLK